MATTWMNDGNGNDASMAGVWKERGGNLKFGDYICFCVNHHH